MLHLLTKCLMCQCFCYYEGTLKQFNATFNTHGKKKNKSIRWQFSVSIPAQGGKIVLLPFYYAHKHGSSKQDERKLSSQTSTKFTLKQNWRTQTSQLNSEGLVIPFLLPTLTQRLHLAATTTSRPRAFPGTACPGPCGNSVPPSQAPNPSRKERPLSPGPYNPTTRTHHCTHCLGRRRIFILRPSLAFTLPPWTLWAAHFPFVQQIRDFRLFLLPRFSARRGPHTSWEHQRRRGRHRCQHWRRD